MNVARNYLSIGEVLALLLEEFPEVTISKIRFLESQGLIEPERTASGYRKFSQPEVDRLKFILREQRENYLPLKVIRNRLDSDTSDEFLRDDEITAPRGLGHIPARSANSHPAAQNQARSSEPTQLFPLPSNDETQSSAMPQQAPPPPQSQELKPTKPVQQPVPIARVMSVVPVAPAVAPTVAIEAPDDKATGAYDRREFIEAAAIDEAMLAELEKFGILRPRRVGVTDLYDEIDMEIILTASKFIALGIDARHLKAWRLAADQELSLFETRIVPMLRQRNPEARQDALRMLSELIEQGGKLRSAFIAAQTRDHIETR